MHSHVLKIIIDPITKIATGVRFKKNGVIYNIGATKEVILSAGAVNSPQILMLSGVGRADHLSSLGIPVIADLNVGDNLQDHITAGGLVSIFNKVFAVKYKFMIVFVFLIMQCVGYSWWCRRRWMGQDKIQRPIRRLARY